MTEFEKELAKMITDASTDARKVDKKTALAMWDSTVLPSALRKKRAEEENDGGATSDSEESGGQGTMNFTLLTKRGNKQQVSVRSTCPSSMLNVRVFLDSVLAYPSGVSSRHPHPYSPATRQRRAAAPEASRARLREARGGGRAEG